MRNARNLFIAVGLVVMGAVSAQAQAPAAQKSETQAALQKEAKVTKTEATALALRTVPNAVVQASEIEREGGKLIWSFDMKVRGKSGIDEVNIDAMTGKLISNQHESPAAEAAEAKADAKAKAAKPAKP
jgi:uncharacterized membrane protein YkoI